MAYRQLFAMTFAVGLGLAACGGETGSGPLSGDPAAQPPTNSDQPTNDTDQPPASSDRPPTSDDQPPASADEPAGTGGGGRLGVLCTQFCAAIDEVVAECGMNDDDLPMEGLCSEELDCSQIPSTPCDRQAAALLSCFIQVFAGICQAVAPGEDGPNVEDLCADETQAAQACAEANGLEDDDMGGPGPGQGPGPGDDDPPPSGSCTAAGGCACADACQGCICRAGSDVTAIQACAMPGSACAP